MLHAMPNPNRLNQAGRIAFAIALTLATIGLVLLASPANAQCQGTTCTTNAQASQLSLVEGWAQVPGGTVWLSPGIHAYEHHTGLVRDIRTGQKFRPITPGQSNRGSNLGNPYQQPTLAPQLPTANPYTVTPRPTVNPWEARGYDVGRYGGGCTNCGVLGAYTPGALPPAPTPRSPGNQINHWQQPGFGVSRYPTLR